MKKTPINTDGEGLAKTVLSGYYKFGCATLLSWGGSTGSAVMEIYDGNAENQAGD